MALQSAIPVSFEVFFPRGAFVVGEVEPVVKWSDDGERQGQDLDKISGQPLWQVRVIDADPDAKKGQGEVTVKIVSISEPQLRPRRTGFRSVPLTSTGSRSRRTSKRGRGGPALRTRCGRAR